MTLQLDRGKEVSFDVGEKSSLMREINWDFFFDDGVYLNKIDEMKTVNGEWQNLISVMRLAVMSMEEVRKIFSNIIKTFIKVKITDGLDEWFLPKKKTILNSIL